MTDAKRLQEIEAAYDEYGDLLGDDIAWLLIKIKQLEKEVQNLRDALASS